MADKEVKQNVDEEVTGNAGTGLAAPKLGDPAETGGEAGAGGEAGTGEAGSGEDLSHVNVQVAVETELLGTNLRGMLSRTMKDRDEKQVPLLEFLVMPSATRENEPITVQKVADEINRMIYKIQNNTPDAPDDLEGPVKTESINAALSLVGMEEAQLSFTQTFVYYKKIGTGEDSSASKEYAIGIHVHCGDKQPKSDEFHFLKIYDVYVNVWDTKREKILEKMEIWSTDQLE